MDLAQLEFEEVTQCILCDSEELSTDLKFRKLLALQPPFNVQRCRQCGLGWLSPRPTEQAFSEFYAYDSYFEGQDAVESYADVARQRANHFRKRLERIAQLAPGGLNSRLLDIGSATGEFVNEALQLGFAAEGMEISDGARRHAKEQYGVDLLEGPLTAENAGKGYDVIHMNHVLEHLQNPLTTLELCHGMLNTGGLLVIEVPQQFENDVERLKYLMRLSKPVFNKYSLHHLYYFRPDTLSALLRRAGYELLAASTQNPDRTPLSPFSLKNLFLRYFLMLSDWIHRGGNIIEVYGRKAV
jgi:2-polyprenyl-3-methyl-5-hydroxy-6-metoxy-1,4-benzoquinol methylase